MKVFISWSGERSKLVALALRDWLPLMLHYVEPWLSAADIDAGQRWANEVGQKLDDCSFGILCLTRSNLQSQWMLYEAGALTKSVSSGAVIPYLIDVPFSELTGPLAQFQAKRTDQASTFELVVAINHKATKPIPQERLSDLFGALWPKLRDRLSLVPEDCDASQARRDIDNILEELVHIMRAVENRTRALSPADQRPLLATEELRDDNGGA